MGFSDPLWSRQIGLFSSIVTVDARPGCRRGDDSVTGLVTFRPSETPRKHRTKGPRPRPGDIHRIQCAQLRCWLRVRCHLLAGRLGRRAASPVQYLESRIGRCPCAQSQRSNRLGGPAVLVSSTTPATDAVESSRSVQVTARSMDGGGGGAGGEQNSTKNCAEWAQVHWATVGRDFSCDTQPLQRTIRRTRRARNRCDPGPFGW